MQKCNWGHSQFQRSVMPALWFYFMCVYLSSLQEVAVGLACPTRLLLRIQHLVWRCTAAFCHPPVVVSFIPFLMYEFDVRHGCMTSYINNAVKKQINLSRDNFNDSLSTPKCTTCLLEERKRHHVEFLLQLLLLLLDKTWQELILFVLWWFDPFRLSHRSVQTHWWSIGLHIILFCIFKTVLYKKQTLTTIIKMIQILFVVLFAFLLLKDFLDTKKSSNTIE